LPFKAMRDRIGGVMSKLQIVLSKL